MASNSSASLRCRRHPPVSIIVCLVSLPFHVGSVKAQQAFQPPTTVELSPPDTLDSMRRMLDLVKDGQQRPATGLSAPTAPALSSPASLAVTTTKFTSSSSWADNRGTWKLEFPSGQVCSVSKLGFETSGELCR